MNPVTALRGAILGRPKPPTLVTTIDPGDGQPPFTLGWRTPTVSDMRASEAQKDSVGKGVTLIRLLAVDPETGAQVFNEKDMEGLLSMSVGLMTKMSEAMAPVFPKATSAAAKLDAPSDAAPNDSSSPESAGK